MRYLLGVDGGNTKTDYLLFTETGEYVDWLRAGTCSHENMDDSYEGAYREMKKQITKLLKRNNLTVSDVAAGGFGLAGDDVPEQQIELDKVVEKLGFTKFVVVNDSMIGIKAGTSRGFGLSCVNGTGTANGAIDQTGRLLQVGGIGELTSDNAGGSFLAREVVKAVYNEAFRCGKKTALTKVVFDAFGITDKYDLMQAITSKFKRSRFDYTRFTIALFEEAKKGDEVSRDILIEMGDTLARSSAGLIKELTFDDDPEVALIGSVWVKAACDVHITAYQKSVNKYSGRNVKINLVTVPPATGAIIWALELVEGHFPSASEREKIINAVKERMDK